MRIKLSNADTSDSTFPSLCFTSAFNKSPIKPSCSHLL